MHRKFRKFRHGGICNIVPGPRGLTGTEHQRLFPDLCGPDFLIQGVDHRESVPLVHLLSVYLKSGRPRGTRRIHHLVRAPGGLELRQSAALSFWLVDRYHSCSDLCVFAHRTAVRKRLTNASLGSSSTGHVSSNRSRKIFHAFSMALKSWDTFGYSSTSFKPQRFKACRASGVRRHPS